MVPFFISFWTLSYRDKEFNNNSSKRKRRSSMCNGGGPLHDTFGNVVVSLEEQMLLVHLTISDCAFSSSPRSRRREATGGNHLRTVSIPVLWKWGDSSAWKRLD
mmetsp:Transcript_5824/g.24512  ORF Transcript_5824/g.24512 Transcript_5824/m.24512 type:complete len:104 (+) Transcript_5824:704-1015(+)